MDRKSKIEFLKSYMAGKKPAEYTPAMWIFNGADYINRDVFSGNILSNRLTLGEFETWASKHKHLHCIKTTGAAECLIIFI